MSQFPSSARQNHLKVNSWLPLKPRTESLANFGLACATVSNDIEYDRLNNKLQVALKQFSTSNKVYCKKCKLMTQMSKREKVKNTYYFACGTYTLSAAQILGTLPDSFILRHVPLEPRHVFHEALSWIGKDELSPELQERSAKLNAVKRYSAHRSPIKAPMSSLLSSRNTPRNQSLGSYLDSKLSKGFIRPSKSFTAAPIFFVSKKSGELRPCVNYTALNALPICYSFQNPGTI